MTAQPDSAELAPSRDPAAYGRRRLMSPSYWAMISLCVLCILAGMAIVSFGPRFFHVRAAPAAFEPQTAPAAATVGYATPATYAPPSTETLQPAQIGALTDRIARLEAAQARTLDAAGAALAASTLSEAAAQPRPFTQDLEAAERAAPANPDVAALASLAGQGAPTRAALAVELNDIAAQVSVAARAPGKDAGIMDQIGYAISRVVSVRRVDPRGSGPDAALARAQRRADAGDLEGAVAALGALPGGARGRLEAWRGQAQRRIDIDRHVAGLRASALATLAAARAGGG